MRILIVAVLAAAVLAIAPSEPASQGAAPAIEQPYPKLAANCPKSGELVIGTKKICYYDCAGTALVKEVGATELCLGSMGS